MLILQNPERAYIVIFCVGFLTKDFPDYKDIASDLQLTNPNRSMLSYRLSNRENMAYKVFDKRHTRVKQAVK